MTAVERDKRVASGLSETVGHLFRCARPGEADEVNRVRGMAARRRIAEYASACDMPCHRMEDMVRKFRLFIYLWMFPELELFESDGARMEALCSAGRRYYRVGMVILVVGTTLTVAFRRWIMSFFNVPEVVVFVLVFSFALSGLSVFWLKRTAIARSLRQQLRDSGMPVCLGCGYDLRGSTDVTPNRCPECGWQPDVSGDEEGEQIR